MLYNLIHKYSNQFCCYVKKQARRVYEILRLKETNVHNDDESKSFRLDVKRRYNILFQVSSLL